MEIPNRHAGPKYFARAGKASWIGIFTDASGKAVGPFVEKPTKDSGDITADIWNSVFIDMIRSGRGPVYMDCTGTSAEDLEYMMWGLRHEGATAMLNYMNAEGIDVRRDRVEFTRYEPFLTGRGIEINEQGETTVEGLFAAGDEVGNLRAALSGAAVFGWIAGERAASRAKEISSFPTAKESPLVEERVDFFSEILERKEGAGWQEVNLALQQIMNDYAGEVRSETLLNVGVKYLRDLRENARQTVKAPNAHTLMRALETLDLIDCGEAVILERSRTKRKPASPHPQRLPLYKPSAAGSVCHDQPEKGRLAGWMEGPPIKLDGFVKSPSAALRGNFVVAAHLEVRLTPQFLRALHLELFTKPSFR